MSYQSNNLTFEIWKDQDMNKKSIKEIKEKYFSLVEKIDSQNGQSAMRPHRLILVRGSQQFLMWSKNHRLEHLGENLFCS